MQWYLFQQCPTNTDTQPHQETAQWNKSDLLSTKKLHWSTWRIKALLKDTSVVVAEKGNKGLISDSYLRVRDQPSSDKAEIKKDKGKDNKMLKEQNLNKFIRFLSA